jgi:hypothetical protein
MRIRKHRIAVGAGVLVGAVAVSLGSAIYAFAGHEPSTVPSLTGCLNQSSGTFVNFALGDTPAVACKDKELQVHLSGGDVTAVSVGPGLTGGGTQGDVPLSVDSSSIVTGVQPGFGLTGGGSGGDVTLAVDPTEVQKRVVSTCDILPGRAIVDIAESGVTTCSEGPLGVAGDKAGGGELPEDPFDPATPPIGSLFLTADSYLVMAKVNVEAMHPEQPANDFMDVDCTLRLPSGPIDRAVLKGDVDIEAGGTITLVAAGEVAGGNVDVVCGDSAAADNLAAQMEWSWLKIVAVRLDHLQPIPLG